VNPIFFIDELLEKGAAAWTVQALNRPKLATDCGVALDKPPCGDEGNPSLSTGLAGLIEICPIGNADLHWRYFALRAKIEGKQEC
jgi:hypothetical protein